MLLRRRRAPTLLEATFSYRVFTDDSIVRHCNGNKRINLCARAVRPWPSVSFRVNFDINNIIEDEERVMSYVDRGARVWRFETIPCTELCPERDRISDDGGDGVFRKASAIVSGILELYPAVPLHAREGAANEFGRVAYQMLSDRRYACRMKLPVFVEITVVSTSAAAASPPPSVVSVPMERRPITAVSGSEEEEEEQVCAICLEVLPVGSQVARLPCSHYFHENCIERWLHAHFLCPLCRRESHL